MDHQQGCSHCNNPSFEEGYANRLCPECRKDLSRHPIAGWVKGLAAGVAVLFLISLFNFPAIFNATLAYRKGKRLMDERKYMSAEKIFSDILKAYPSNFKMNAHYVIAAFHNRHYAIVDSVMKKWAGKSPEDREMVAKVNAVIEQSRFLEPEDPSVSTKLDSTTNRKEYIKVLEQYHALHQHDVAGMLALGEQYYIDSSFKQAIDILEVARKAAPEALFGHRWLALSYAGNKQFDKGLEICEELLSDNVESIDGLTAKAGILLKKKDDKKALALAQQMYDLAPSNPYAICTLALAAHFNGNTAKRDELCRQLHAMNDSVSVAFIKGVEQDKIHFRD